MKIFTLFAAIIISIAVLAHPHARDSISFDYTFQKSDQMANSFTVNARIKNHSSKRFYFLNQSCNGLDYYLTTNSTKVSVSILVHCNQSVPQKKSIPPGGTYEFTSRITTNGQIEKVALNLSLIQVSEAYSVAEKFISDVEKAHKMHTLLLSGPVRAVPK